MTAGTTGWEPVTAEESLLLRYAVRGHSHVSKRIDQGTGRRHLTKEAFRFNPDLSVSRPRILDDHGIPHDALRQPGYASLARLVAADVLAVEVKDDVKGAVRPFSIGPSPWPRGREGAAAVDVAHASVTWARELAEDQQRRARTALGRAATLDPLDEPG